MSIEPRKPNQKAALSRRIEIHSFVVDFYSEVRKHETLGPIFNTKIGDNWAAHFEILTDFWMTVLLGVPCYKGNPFLAHRDIPDIKDHHFDTWLQIFADSATRTLDDELATTAILKSRRIANSLRQGLLFRAA